MKEDKKLYLSQRDLFEEVIRCRINGHISEKLGEMYIKLSTKIANHHNFVRYLHLREDLIAAGAMACCKSFEKFHPYQDKEREWDEETMLEYDYTIHANVFSYHSSSVFNAFLQVLKREYAFSNAVNASRLQEGYDASYGYSDMISEQEEEMRQQRIEEGELDQVAPHLAEISLWDEEIGEMVIDEVEEKSDGIEW